MGKRRIMLDTRKVSTVDDSITHRFWPATKHPEPVLLGDRPWERFGPLLFGTVMFDQARYRMWYNPYPVVPPPGNSYYVGYAESFDGLHWEKPDLVIEPYGDSQRTNLVNLIRHNPSVVLDVDDPDSEQRFKATGYVGTEQIMKERNAAYPGNGYYLAHSPDGLHWTEYPAIGPIGTVHDVGNFISDEPRGRYFGTVKQQVRYATWWTDGLWPSQPAKTFSAGRNPEQSWWQTPSMTASPGREVSTMPSSTVWRWILTTTLSWACFGSSGFPCLFFPVAAQVGGVL